MEFFEGKPEMTPQLIQRSLVTNWMKLKEGTNREFFNPSEITYYLFDNLFRVVSLRAELMEVTYNTLIKLNLLEKNLDMVEHLETTKKDYINNDRNLKKSE